MRLFGKIRLSVSPAFVLALAAMYFLDRSAVTVHVLLASVLHELGHACAAGISGGRVTELRLGAAGADMRVSLPGENTVFRELLLCLSGPAVNIAAAQAAAALGARLNEPRLFVFSGASLVLGLFNLIPLSRLDGGRVLMVILERYAGAAADTVIFMTELVLSSAMTLAGIFVFFRSGYNFTLLCVGAWCFVCFITDRGRSSFLKVKKDENNIFRLT